MTFILLLSNRGFNTISNSTRIQNQQLNQNVVYLEYLENDYVYKKLKMLATFVIL